MNRTACTIVGFTFALTLALAPGGIAQQQQHQEHHPSGAQAAQDKPTMTAAEEQEQAPMMQPMRGMMGAWRHDAATASRMAEPATQAQ